MEHETLHHARRLSLGWALGVALLVGGDVVAQLPPRGDPPFIATPDDLVEEMLKLGEVGPGTRVYDLGSGDGRIPIAAAAAGGFGVGIEYDPALVLLSRDRATNAGVSDRVRFVQGDVFEADLSEADVVTLYLSPEFNIRLRPRLLEQLRPGARIVSHAFHMGDWAPDTTVTLGTGVGRATLFSWVVPVSIDGFWSLRVDGMEPVVLELFQKFQRFSGTARREGRELPVHDGTLKGAELRFELVGSTADPTQRFVFHGSMEGGSMRGIVDGGPAWGRRLWRAHRFSDPTRFGPDASR